MKSMKRITALILVFALAALSVGCQLVEVDPAKDFVADANGEKISQQELDELFAQYAQFYAMFGMDLNSDAAQAEAVKQDVLNSLIEQKVILQNAKTLGMDTFTAEEQAEIDAEYDSTLQQYKENYRAQAQAEADADASIDVEARMTEMLEAEMTAQGITFEQIKSDIAQGYMYNKLQDSVKSTVNVTEADAQALYDTKLAEQKAAIADGSSTYDSYASSGDALTAPEGYMYVKHVLVSSTPEGDDATKVSELEAKVEELATQAKNLTVEGRTENEAEINDLNAQIDAATAEKKAITDKYEADAKAQADEIYAKASASGADFDALIAEFGDDPGMTSEPGKTTGYLVGPATTSYVEEFKNAAIALTADGAVSQPVKSTYGYHIMKRVSTVAAGDTAFADVKDKLLEQAKAEAETKAWDDKVNEWMNASKILIDGKLVNWADRTAPAAQ